MKKILALTTVLVVGILIGAVMTGSVLAAPPTPQGRATPTVPGAWPGQIGRWFMHGGAWGGMMDIGFEDEVLSLLGMTREQIIAERQAGKSLVEIAQSKGVSEQQLVDTILAAKRADLDQLVRDGKLTQTQADAMYANMQQVVAQMVNRTTFGPIWGDDNNTRPGHCPMWDEDDTPGNSQPTAPARGRGGMMRSSRWSGPTS